MNSYNKFVHLPNSKEECIKECKGFIENYEFPCAGAWDGFQVHITTCSKNYFSFCHQHGTCRLYQKIHSFKNSLKNSFTYDICLQQYSSLFKAVWHLLLQWTTDTVGSETLSQFFIKQTKSHTSIHYLIRLIISMQWIVLLRYIDSSNQHELIKNMRSHARFTTFHRLINKPRLIRVILLTA